MKHKPAKQENRRIINHKVLRQGTGVIALLMPLLVEFLSDQDERLSSISISYWTDSGDIFVGSLVAVGFFLAAYNGTGACDKDTEYWISKFAGIFALIVAFIPTGCGIDHICDIPAWVNKLTHGHLQFIHNLAAILLFVCLYMLINFFARRAKSKGEDLRSDIYWLISLCMLIGMPVVYYIGLNVDWYNPIYGVEFVGLMLFGSGWILAGSYKSNPNPEPPDNIEWVKEIEVHAKEKHNPTDISVSAVDVYYFEATGCWKDLFLGCGPTGWGPHWKWWTNFNRVRNQPIFMLCGNIGQDDTYAFGIGKQIEWEVPKEIDNINSGDRKLYLFANDWSSKYGNNSESVLVKIYKKKAN
ncbi:MAG: hypothetical protein HKN09_04180 [Saprospiraceae bacterium]|nr:hypothetical protein [Saprospiraceae bacterium]